MPRFLSINGLLQTLTGVMVMALVVTFGLEAWRAWDQRSTAEQVVVVTSISRDLFHALQNIFDAHFLAAMKCINCIAPGTTQVAAGQTNKDARKTSAGSFALNGFKYFGDEHKTPQTPGRVYCPPPFAFFPERFDSQ